MEQREIKQFLSEQSLFAGLAEAQLETLAAHARERDLESDQVLASQGARAESFYLILDGALVIEVPALTGPKLEVTRLGEGEVFGWSWLIAPYEWHFHARASGPTRVLEFDGKALLERCEADPAFGYPLLRRFSELMARRLDAAQRKMMDQWSPPGFA
ncbi:Crp/Fnr family transcriptional regulator [Wenzhouxiangella limi]|uniref:Crp/Fnr family transcriptional regulator n=1 Tax=Wenzhouxiangella limi TaxID=2707351 RepID=A0A845V3N3_9GAMM|nr:Crp/Fnr family transcriptional regulator [Wenzhouxiangella limi]NDY94595.1 Crp/Fnr family transcriptional regulator [Wenzhouxiangella limi]